jgi:hypothetical protein
VTHLAKPALTTRTYGWIEPLAELWAWGRRVVLDLNPIPTSNIRLALLSARRFLEMGSWNEARPMNTTPRASSSAAPHDREAFGQARGDAAVMNFPLVENDTL